MKIKNLTINRLPGFPKGIEEYKDLAGNINIVAGPNGVGKSSSARAIQKLIWWNDKITGDEINGLLDINNEINEVRIDSQGYTRINSNKRTHEDFSFVFPREFSNQYMLALHDLINGRDDNLARIIAKEVNGGVDLNKAANRLEYKSSTPNIAQPRYKFYLDSQKELTNLENAQAIIQKKEERLHVLEEDKKRSEEASGYKDLFGKIYNYLNAKSTYETCKAKLNTFPVSFSKFRPDDFSQVESLDKKIAEVDTSIREAERNIQNSRQEISSLHIGDDEVPEEMLNELSERIENLKTIQQNISTLDREINNLQVIKERTGKLLVPSEEMNDLREINISESHYLNEFIQAANEAEGIHANLLNEKRRLDKELNDLNNNNIEKTSIEDVRKGITILSDWLKGKTSAPYQSLLILIGIVVWTFLSTLITYYVGSEFLTISFIITFLLIPAVLIFEKKNVEKQNQELIIRVNDFSKCTLQPPAKWDSSSVAKRIEELINTLEVLLHKSRVEAQISDAGIKLKESITRLASIRSEYYRIKEEMGMLPEKLDSFINNYNSFYLFLSNITKWQDAAIEYDKLVYEKQTYCDSYNNELSIINSILEGFNFTTVGNHVEAAAVYKALLNECDIKSGIYDDIKYQRNIIELKQQEKENYLKSIGEIYSRLEISEGSRKDIYAINAEYHFYQEAEKNVVDAVAMVNANEQLLKTHPLYEIYQEQNKEITVEEAQQKVEEYDYLSSRQSHIIREISEIKAQIQERKSKDDIEKALSKKDDAIDGLNELLKTNLKSITGDLIISHLHEEISLNNENPVFIKANKILGNITKKRYKLILGEGRQPVFKAYDNKLKRIQLLEEISTGTRVQLLIAIRLAYIETQENQIKLPVLADELLANSDDDRSEAIIQALVEISRNRQLFYFTAQREEVSKWEEYLAKCSDIEWKTTLLAYQ